MTTLSKPQLQDRQVFMLVVILFMLFDATLGELGYAEHHIPVYGTLA